MNLNDALGAEWRDLPAAERWRTRFTDRCHHIGAKSGFIDRVLPEYRGCPAKRVIDFSCGNGVLLELFRHYGHQVLGVDIQYFAFLRSQGIPYITHDCRVLPYPPGAGVCDLVTCVGAISTYGELPWGEVLSEFARIARECFVVVPNQGEILDARRGELEGWRRSGWQRHKVRHAYKWCRDG